MNSIAGKKLFRNLSIITLLILVISLFWLGTKPEWVSLFPTDPPADKFVHVFFFGFITALLWFSSLTSHSVINLVIPALIAVADEWHQYYIPERTASFTDFSADLVGIVLVIIVLNYIHRK